MAQKPMGEVHIEELLLLTKERGCRELFLRVGQSPCMRYAGGYPRDPLLEYEAMHGIDVQQMIYGILTDEEIRTLERDRTLAFSYSSRRTGKFDGHARWANNTLEAELTLVPNER